MYIVYICELLFLVLVLAIITKTYAIPSSHITLIVIRVLKGELLRRIPKNNISRICSVVWNGSRKGNRAWKMWNEMKTDKYIVFFTPKISWLRNLQNNMCRRWHGNGNNNWWMMMTRIKMYDVHWGKCYHASRNCGENNFITADNSFKKFYLLFVSPTVRWAFARDRASGGNKLEASKLINDSIIVLHGLCHQNYLRHTPTLVRAWGNIQI